MSQSLDLISAKAQSYEREARILEQEKTHLEEKYLSEFKKFEESQERCKAAEKEAKRATELADGARSDAITSQREKSELEKLSMERLALIERAERQIESLERETAKLEDQLSTARASEAGAISKVSLLEDRLDDTEREMEQILSQNNEQRSNTVQVLESLLSTERQARLEASNRAEALSLQLQTTQGKLDLLQQELTAARLNESALDGKLRTASREKRSRMAESVGFDSAMDVDEETVKARKKLKRTSSPTRSYSLHFEEEESTDYNKFTVLKLKQELTKHGFGAELLQIKNPNKREILSLYEKHVLGK